MNYHFDCACRVIGSELVQKYVGEGARMVRELFEMARLGNFFFFNNLLYAGLESQEWLLIPNSFRTKKACLIFFDEIDAVGGARFDDGAGGDNEVTPNPIQSTILKLC